MPERLSRGLGVVALAAVAAGSAGVACGTARPAALVAAIVVPGVPPESASFVRGTAEAAGSLSDDDQTQIVDRVLSNYYYPGDYQARWLDPRPLAHVRFQAADDTVGADPDFADEVITAVRDRRYCVLGGRDFGCRGKKGGIVRVSWPYRIAVDSAVVYAIYTPRDSLGVAGKAEPERQFRLRFDPEGYWELRKSVPVNPTQGTARSQAQRAITNVTVIDVRAGRAIPNQTVVITGNRISAVGDAASFTFRPPIPAVDGRGKFLIPGLWDMHVHTSVVMGRELLSLYVANGVTGVRDMADEWEVLKGWRNEIGAGTLVGPRIVASGPYLEGGDVPIPHILTRTPAEGIAGVDSLVKLGVDFVKVHGQLRPETYYAIARRAREKRIAFGGHVSQAVGAANASDSGQKSLEHMLAIPAPCTSAESLTLRPQFPVQSAIGRCRSIDLNELYARFVRNKTWVTPTFTAAVEIARWPLRDLPGDSLAGYLPDTLKKFVLQLFPMPDSIPRGADSVGRAMLAKRMRQLADMHHAGVEVLTGTDAPLRNSPPGFGLHEELTLLVRGGLTPAEALRAATLAPARYLNATDSLGTIAKGKVADLVLLDANPLLDINNTRRIAGVVSNGRYFDAAGRAQLLRAAVDKKPGNP